MRPLPSTTPELFRPGLQSALNPHGPHAEAVTELTTVLVVGGALIFVAVMALAAYAVWGPARGRRWSTSERFVVGAGVAFPLIALGALLVYSLSLTPRVAAAPQPGDPKIEIVAEQWWWRVQYLDDDGRTLFETANEVRLPVGRPVELRLKSADVIHSFWVPTLAGKLDMIPGRTNRMRLTAERAGIFRGQCAEYCGGPHAWMALYVVAEPPAAFDGWQARQREPARAADGPLAAGERHFLQHCAACHTVRGTAAAGTLGPDLTHVGSRLSIGAGMLPNNVGGIAAWIAGSQNIKPGNLMPSMNVIGGDRVRQIAAYLDQLD